MTPWNLAFAIAGVPVLLATLYLLGCTLLWRRAAPVSRQRVGGTRFVVAIPAHDEERGLGATLESLEAMDYPRHLWRLLVIADNCTDRTADEARRHGAEVLERHDDLRRGKGYALQFAIDTLLAEPGDAWGALLVVDADTSVSRNLLEAMSQQIVSGRRAVQAAYLPRPASGGLSVITEVAFTAFHLVRSGARERLGLSCGLRGNGMAFSRQLLAEVPHDAFSRAEDLEYGIRLGLAGVRVAYAGDAVVRGDMPERESVAARQRERWIGGRVELARRFAPGLLARAWRERSPMLADLACDLLVPPLSVLVALLAAGLISSAALAMATGALTGAVIVWSVAWAAMAAHVAHAALLSGRGAAFFGAVLSLPRYAFGKALITMRSFATGGGAWIRTRREGEME
jgi:cellulose synthase/poly-beta-1,6-N-acetylglucosamine synthase-like glycosyltransferase